MTERVIPLLDLRAVRSSLPEAWLSHQSHIDATGLLSDTLGRPLRDLRISVMDRCNFRCPYCMPQHTFHDGYRFLASAERLGFGEIVRLARLGARLYGESVSGGAQGQRTRARGVGWHPCTCGVVVVVVVVVCKGCVWMCACVYGWIHALLLVCMCTHRCVHALYGDYVGRL